MPELSSDDSDESTDSEPPLLRSLSCPSPEQSAERLHSSEAGVFRAEWGLAPQGVLAVELPSDAMGTVSLVPETSVIVLSADSVFAYGSVLFEKLGDAFEEGRTNWVIVSGPSATADMGALVQGVHGPAEVHVVVTRDDDT
jgi:L-lactate dehydrogenase complex protein LldG